MPKPVGTGSIVWDSLLATIGVQEALLILDGFFVFFLLPLSTSRFLQYQVLIMTHQRIHERRPISRAGNPDHFWG